MEGGICEQAAEGEPGKTKVVVSRAEGEVSNRKFSVVCEMWQMDSWKCKRK